MQEFKNQNFSPLKSFKKVSNLQDKKVTKVQQPAVPVQIFK